MAVGPFSITAEREAVVDYPQAFMEDGAGIIMRKPSPHADDMVRIFLPFHNHVWFSICSFVLLAGKCIGASIGASSTFTVVALLPF